MYDQLSKSRYDWMSVCQFVLWRSPVSDVTFAAVSLGAPPLTRLRVKVTVHVFFYDYFRNSTAFWKVPRLRPSVLLVRATRRWKWVWSFGGVEWNVLTGRNANNWRKPCPSDTFLMKNPYGLARVRNRAKTKINNNCFQRPSPYRAVNTLRLNYTNQSVNVV